MAAVIHAPDDFRLVLLIVAGHGHTQLVAKVVVATRDLRHDPELLGYVRLVASPAHCFLGGSTLFTRAVARGDEARARELLDACPTAAARAALLAAGDARGAPPLALAGTAGMARLLLGEGASALAAGGGGGADDVLDAVVRAGRLGVLEVLLESLGSDEARRERLARVDARGATLLWRARKRSIAQALLDAGATLVPPQSAARDAAAVDELEDAYPSYDDDEEEDEEDDDDEVVGDSGESGGAESVGDAFFAGWDALDKLTPGGSSDGGSAKTDVLADWAALVSGDDAEDDDQSITHGIELDEDALKASLAALRALQTKAQRRRWVDLADEAGLTLLMKVAQMPQSRRSQDYLFELLLAGVDVYAVDDNGHDAFDYADLAPDEQDFWHVDAVHIQDLLYSPGSKRVRALRVNRRDRRGRTMLMRVRSREVAESLVATGASAWGVDHDGHDALRYALEDPDEIGWGVYAVVPVLIEAMGASERRRRRVNAADDNGETPLMHATSWESARALIAAGADPLIEDNDGNDAFWHASHLKYDFDKMVLKEMLASVPSVQQRRRIREEYVPRYE